MAGPYTTELDNLRNVTAGDLNTDSLNVNGTISVPGGITVTGGSINTTGKTSVALVRNDYSSVNVTTAAYVQLIASLADSVTALHIFDSSGQTLVLATGAAAAEVNQIYIPPGGNDLIPLTIAAGTRVSIKAVSATASAGELDISFLK